MFEGKYGLITLRDLFRWGHRYRLSSGRGQFNDWEQHLAEDGKHRELKNMWSLLRVVHSASPGFLLLAARLRTAAEQQDVKKAILDLIKKHFKRSVNPDQLFGVDGGSGSLTTRDSLALLHGQCPEGFGHMVWTPELLRMGVIVQRALTFGEPVLLVGETGCGKTSLCQMLALRNNRPYSSINCHMHTEATDFLGGLRPVRNRNVEDEVEEWVGGCECECD